MAITDELLDVVRQLAKRTDPLSTVRAMETDPDAWTRHWPALTELGLLTVTRDGGDLADQAAAVEHAAHHLLPGPIPSTVLANLLLGADAAVLLTPAELTLDGDRLTGAATPVLGARADTPTLLPVEDVWCLAPPRPVTPLTPLDFSRPVGRVAFADTPVSVLDVDTPTVWRHAATLFAAEAAGVARWCLDTAVAYAKVREQFDRPIGSFQAVKHLCAEMLCRAEQAAALAWDAARGGELSATAAAALAIDAAVDNAKDCVQVLGGIGFTWEHDAHLYLRRALANRQLLGGTTRWRRETARQALAGVRRVLAVSTTDDQVRAEARQFARDIAALSTEEQRVRLADSGYLTPHWPRPYGLAASPRAQLVIDEELTRAGIRRPDLVVGAWAIPTILAHGTEEQRKRFAAPTLRGELHWCQLFSEPDAGSDLASLRTKAIRAEGGWRLSGQKVWTSAATQADWAICLARTDPHAPTVPDRAAKHAGITYFLVDMRTEGITLRPLREITGAARFNEVFLDDVFVPDDCVVGAVGGGWPLARTTLANERVAIGAGSPLGDGVERLLALAGRRDVDSAHERIGFLVAQGLSVSLVDLRATLRQLDGRGPGPESSVSKLIGVRQRQDVAEAAVDLLGTTGVAVDPTTEPVLHEFLLTRCLSIAGGTTQVLRTLVAERILGLPREKR